MSAGEIRYPVIVLDLDGTLVDSVYQHVVAWQTAFHDVGLRVSAQSVHEAIGLGGDLLVSHVAGDAAEWAVGDEVRKFHDEHFRAIMRGVSELDGASDLIVALNELGHQLVLASSSEADIVNELLDHVDARAELAAVVSGSDARRSKPAPDLIEVALGRAGPGDAVAIGDATWDAVAAKAAGIDCIGLRSGGINDTRLREAGASWVFDGPRDLLQRLEQSPLGSVVNAGS